MGISPCWFSTLCQRGQHCIQKSLRLADSQPSQDLRGHSCSSCHSYSPVSVDKQGVSFSPCLARQVYLMACFVFKGVGSMKKLHSTCPRTRRYWWRSTPMWEAIHLYIVGRGVHQPADNKLTCVAGRREFLCVVQHFTVTHTNDKAIEVACHRFPDQSEVMWHDFWYW